MNPKAAEPFLCLREHRKFRDRIRRRITLATTGTGFHAPAADGTSPAKTAWKNKADEFAPHMPMESARWSLIGRDAGTARTIPWRSEETATTWPGSATAASAASLTSHGHGK